MKIELRAYRFALIISIGLICFSCENKMATAPIIASSSSKSINASPYYNISAIVNGDTLKGIAYTEWYITNPHGGFEGEILLTDSNATALQQIILYMPNMGQQVGGNYTLNINPLSGNNVNIMFSGATYSVGPNSNNLTIYNTDSTHTGSLTITSPLPTSSEPPPVSGTFSFTAVNGSKTITVTGGVFNSIPQF